ncbi:MAG: outer membrane beta-barrel protein [Bacteroidales bacterium]
MTKQLFLAGVFVLASACLLAQRDLAPGSILQNNGDTLTGFLRDNGKMKNATDCVFYSSRDAGEQVFHPGDIRGYSFDDGFHYTSKAIETPDGPATYFLEFLVDGTANLYFLRTDRFDAYLIETPEGKMVMLPKSGSHARILKGLFSDCMDIQDKLNNPLFSHAYMTKVVSQYHACTSDPDDLCRVYTHEKDMFKGFVGIRGGMRYTTFFFVNHPRYHNDVYTSWSSPVYGLYGGFSLPRLNKNLRFQLALDKIDALHHNTTYGEVNETTYTQDYEFSYQALQFSPGAEYSFGSGRFSPYLGFGLRLFRLLDFESSNTVTIEYNGETTVENYEMYEFTIPETNVGTYLNVGARLHLSDLHGLQLDVVLGNDPGLIENNTRTRDLMVMFGYRCSF